MLNTKKYQNYLDDLILKDISNNPFFSEEIFNQITNHSLQGGKRLRSIIVLTIANRMHQRFVESESNSNNNNTNNNTNSNVKGTLNLNKAALFVEFIHNASLIVDDLPIMDDDEIRRGKPTVHSKWGSSNALLASYNLVITAFRYLSDNILGIKDYKYFQMYPEQYQQMNQIIYSEITDQLGFLGLCGGQYLDLNIKEKINSNPNNMDLKKAKKEKAIELVEKKTSSLFIISFVLGWLLSGGEINQLNKVKNIGNSFGIMFQIVDDIDDLLEDLQKGKGNNICEYYSKEEIKQLFKYHLENYTYNLKELEIYTPVFAELRNYLIQKFKEGWNKYF